jgi:hypothetical protein
VASLKLINVFPIGGIRINVWIFQIVHKMSFLNGPAGEQSKGRTTATNETKSRVMTPGLCPL